MISLRVGWWALALWLAHSRTAEATSPIDYLLDLREPSTHLIRVTMTVPAASPAAEIQFPAWYALYQIRDFVRNVQELRADCDGLPRELNRVDLCTWRTGSESCSSLEVRYAVYANEEGAFSSVLNDQHSFMNPAQLLFYLPKERERGARVKFLLPTGWKLATLLEGGKTAGEFKAPNYDALADSPAEAGEFHEYRYTQNGARFRIVVHADPRDYSSERLLASLEKITAAEMRLMGDVPFSQYTFILHFPRGGRGSGMEHRDGAAITFPVSELHRDWNQLEETLAHEFFHLWNVKRIRPQGLEPVDYVHANDTRDLWFSEGVTSAYTKLALLRAGIITRQVFYGRLAAEIQELAERPARLYQSVEEAGRQTWFEKYPDYLRPERSISYYNKGALVAFLLDLAIRHASRNRTSLDDVMRRLNQDFAHRGRFFTSADLRALIAGLSPDFAGLDAFFGDFVSGTREIGYDTYLGYAGLRLRLGTEGRPAFGFLAVQNIGDPVQVESVEPGSDAERAGLEAGDILLKMNGQPLRDLPEDQFSEIRPGRKVNLRVRRGNREFELKFALARKRVATYRVEEIENATPQQLQVREGWLSGKMEAAGAEGNR